jgi:hypothetical protein
VFVCISDRNSCNRNCDQISICKILTKDSEKLFNERRGIWDGKIKEVVQINGLKQSMGLQKNEVMFS